MIYTHIMDATQSSGGKTSPYLGWWPFMRLQATLHTSPSPIPFPHFTPLPTAPTNATHFYYKRKDCISVTDTLLSPELKCSQNRQSKIFLKEAGKHFQSRVKGLFFLALYPHFGRDTTIRIDPPTCPHKLNSR
jgi:hypothetical protein